MTPVASSVVSVWRSWRPGRRSALPPSRLLIRRALNDPVIFEALLRETEAHERFSKAPAFLRPRLWRAFLAAATETDRLCEERLCSRMTPEAAARAEQYAEARRTGLPRREALLFAAGRLSGTLPTSAGPTSSPAAARPTEAPAASERGAA